MFPRPTQFKRYPARRRPQRRQESSTTPTSGSSAPPPTGTGTQPQDDEPGDGTGTSEPPVSPSESSSSSSSASSSTKPTKEPETDTPSSTITSSRTSSSTSSTRTTTSTTTEATSSSTQTSDTVSIPLSATNVAPVNATLPTDSAGLTLSEGMVLTTMTTEINGQQTVIVTAVPSPTALSSDDARASERSRIIAIAAGTTGAVFLLSLILAIIFLWKRRKNRELGFIEGLLKKRREGKGAGSVGLLDAEFDDDDDKNVVGLSRYRDNPTPLIAPSNTSPAPSLFRARASDSGSIFHEGVWPPPGQESRFIDPLLVKSGRDVDLNSIVDDVMGPAPGAAAHMKERSSVSSTSTSSLLGGAAPPAESAPGHLSLGSIGSLYNDPFRSAEPGASTNSESVYYYRPDSQLSLNSPDASYSPSSATTPPSPTTSPYPSSLLGLPAGAAAPKKPSPLIQSVVASCPPLFSFDDRPSLSFTTATSSSSVTPTPKNWIERSPKKGLRDLKSPSSSSPPPTLDTANIGRAI